MQHNHQNNDSCIFGVDPEKTYTAEDVRDAMLRCFVQANGENIAKQMNISLPENPEEKIQKINELTVTFLRKAFEETGGNYDQPDKNSIKEALMKLKEFAEKSGHQNEMIEKHASQIMELVEGLE